MDDNAVFKYTQMENVLQKINSKYIALPENDKRINTKILEKILDTLTLKMKEKDALFKGMFERTFYGGSYYDGLKVGKPEEYDLDFVLTLPSESLPTVEISDKHGFVHVVINDYQKFLKSNQAKKYEKLDSLLENEKYLSISKILSWFEKVSHQALKEFQWEEEDGLEGYVFEIESEKIFAKLSKAFPAFTLKLKSKSGIEFDIDLVPCIQFTDKHWPRGEYRENPVSLRNKFLVVPKVPYETDEETMYRYWRLSFQEQEREIMSGPDFRVMKAVIKLLKKLRDFKNHSKISSYYIKTIFLWELENREKSFWSQTLSAVFMQMLNRYEEFLRNKSIPYYWNKNYNLIQHLKEATIIDIANCIKRIIDNVNKRLSDPFVIAKYMLFPSECDSLKEEVIIGKKYKKSSVVQFNFDDSLNQLSDSNETNSEMTSTTARPAANDEKPSLESIDLKLNSVLRKLDLLYEEGKVNNLRECVAHSGNSTIEHNLLGQIEKKIDVLCSKVDENVSLCVYMSKSILNLETQMQMMVKKLEDICNERYVVY